MKQSGSMESSTTIQLLSKSPQRRCVGVSGVLTLTLGVPLLLCSFAAHSAATPAQHSVQRNSAHQRLSDTVLDVLQDRDGDGLDDALEAGQFSSADSVDSDNDGWNDAEELARGSLATAAASQPTDHQTSIGSSAYMRAGKLHVALACYLRGGSLTNAELKVGICAAGRMVLLAPSGYAHHATVTTVPTKTPGELLVVTDIIVPYAPLVRLKAMSIFATLQVGDFQHAATAIDLVMQGGTPMVLLDPAQVAPSAYEQLGPGLLHRPLGGSTPPITWSSGEICFQHLESVGTHGAVVTQEVTSASCISGWDGYCDASSCASSVGTTVDLVDPAGLIGG